MKFSHPARKTPVHIFLIAVLMINLFPLLLLLMNSLKSRGEMLTNPLGFPQQIRWSNYPEVWEQGNYASAFANTLLITAVTILVVLVLSGSCAYATAKLNPRGGTAVVNYFMFTMSVSVSLCLVPLFYLWMKLKLMNTLTGLIIIYCGINIPFTVIIMRSFFLGIPGEILESARIDGCNEWKTLWKIVFPISKPVFLTSGLLTGLSAWNEFFYANSFIQADNLRTVATRYLTFTGQHASDWSKISAGGIITIIPMVILYLIFQRQFIEGLTSGSVKG